MKSYRTVRCAIMALVCLVFSTLGFAAESFSDIVGPVNVGEVQNLSPLSSPYITWGGDVATFYANGGLQTKPDTIYGKLGLNLKLTAGDDFIQQVRDYMSGKSPFLRGTFHMIGLASEVIGSDPRTKGVVIDQLTFSVGDHCVSRSYVKTVADLKGKKIVLQKCGPHVGMLDDILKTAQLSWKDINVIWADDLTGSPKSPAEMFRSDSTIDACFVISPDMLGLCGGLQSTGTGAEGSVKGARVLVSTAQLSKSIADVYVVRKDFYDAHRDLVTKFVAGYLKACEEVVELKKQYEAKGSPAYMKLLGMAQQIYGVKVLPTLETDAHGLLCDCAFVGYPGNVAFFTEKGNLNGFEAFHKSALDLAINLGYASVRTGLFPSGLDYSSNAFVGYLQNVKVQRQDKFKAEAVQQEIEALNAGTMDDKTIYTFAINFEANQDEFSTVQYGAEFDRVVKMMSKYGNAVVAIRGHSDPTKTLVDLIKAGIKKGIIQQSGTKGNYQYFFSGKPLDLNATGEVVKLVESGAFDGVAEYNPRETMQAGQNLSLKRAQAVRDAIAKYAADNGLALDKTQIQPVGVGVREPLIAKPKSVEEAAQNMRVEFRLIKVSAEAAKPADFDY